MWSAQCDVKKIQHIINQYIYIIICGHVPTMLPLYYVEPPIIERVNSATIGILEYKIVFFIVVKNLKLLGKTIYSKINNTRINYNFNK